MHQTRNNKSLINSNKVINCFYLPKENKRIKKISPSVRVQYIKLITRSNMSDIVLNPGVTFRGTSSDVRVRHSWLTPAFECRQMLQTEHRMQISAFLTWWKLRKEMFLVITTATSSPISTCTYDKWEKSPHMLSCWEVDCRAYSG